MKRTLKLIILLILILLLINLFACKGKTHAVTFDGGDGILVSGDVAQSVENGKAAIAPILEKEGYTLSWDKAFDNITNDLTITAVWTINKYTVTFNGNDGTLISGDETQTITYGSGASAPIYEKENYTLSWDKAFDNITNDLIVTAVWTNNLYTVTFNGNGGTLINGDETQIINYGNGAIAPVYIKNGYYLQWDSTFDNIQSDITINAIWYSKDLIYTLINGGYSVGTDRDYSDLIIPKEHNGLPVIELVSISHSDFTTITIPDTIIRINASVFRFCRKLESIFVNEDNKFFTSVDGNLYNKNVTEILRYAPNKKDSSFTIPASVTQIAEIAFNYCNNLTSINVDENNQSFKSIDGNIYNKDATILLRYTISKQDTSFRIPDSVISIGNSAFFESENLTSIIITENIKQIDDYAFYCCHGLTSIIFTDRITSIGNYAFAYCSSLTSITIPDSVISIGNYAFSSTTLTSITIGNSVTSIGSHAFYYCQLLSSINIPDSVTSIGNNAFHNCYSLTSINIPNNVTTISDNMFYRCDNLTSVTIGNSVTSIGMSAFCGTGISSITIPDNVKIIGNMAFYACKKITSATIGNGVTSIGAYAFNNCTNLTSITIGHSVTSIGNAAFANCKSLPAIIIPDNVNAISISMFEKCSALATVTIGKNVTSIKNKAFFYSGLTSINIPDNVVSIENDAFNSCQDLKSAIISNNVTIINESTFNSCMQLASVTIGKSVISIGNKAFYFCGFTSIVIPDNVIDICDSAFEACKKATSITIGNSVTSIGTKAFDGMSLTSINVKSENTVYKSQGDCIIRIANNEVILGCRNSVIPEGVETIGSYAFISCGMNTITFPESLQSIKSNAFFNCTILSIIIKNSTISIDDAFNNCNNSLMYVEAGADISLWKNIGILYLKNCTLDETKTYIVSINKTYDTLIDSQPYRSGYHFDGWYTTPDFSGTMYSNIGSAPQGILYARWREAQEYTITFIYYDNDKTTTLSYKIHKGDLINYPVAIKKDYTFMGWNTYDGMFYFEVYFITMPNNEDLTLHALYMYTPPLIYTYDYVF